MALKVMTVTRTMFKLACFVSSNRGGWGRVEDRRRIAQIWQTRSPPLLTLSMTNSSEPVNSEKDTEFFLWIAGYMSHELELTIMWEVGC